MNTTVRLRASDIVKDWHVVDAAGRPLGRVASEVAVLLRGKHKPTYEPHLDAGDFVIVINAAEVRLTGNKAEQKQYHWHTGYPGGIKARSWTEQMERDPARIIETAVTGMLPKNRLGRQIIRHLKVYNGPDHPHAAQLTGAERARAQRGDVALPRSRRSAIPRGFIPGFSAIDLEPVRRAIEALQAAVPDGEDTTPAEAGEVEETAVADTDAEAVDITVAEVSDDGEIPAVESDAADEAPAAAAPTSEVSEPEPPVDSAEAPDEEKE